MPKYPQRSIDLRRKALWRRRLHGFKEVGCEKINPKLIESFLRNENGPRERARHLIRKKIKQVSLAYVDDSDPLGILETADMKGFVLKRSMDALEESCDFCKEMKNAEVIDGVYTRLLCDSCKMRVSTQFECPGGSPNCEKTLWVNSLGLPSALCRECDRCEQMVISYII